MIETKVVIGWFKLRTTLNVIGWIKLQLWKCELSDNKLSNNKLSDNKPCDDNLASNLVENIGVFLTQSQSRKVVCYD